MGAFKSRILVAPDFNRLFGNLAFFTSGYKTIHLYTCVGCIVLYPEEGTIAETLTNTLVTASIL